MYIVTKEKAVPVPAHWFGTYPVETTPAQKTMSDMNWNDLVCLFDLFKKKYVFLSLYF